MAQQTDILNRDSYVGSLVSSQTEAQLQTEAMGREDFRKEKNKNKVSLD